MYNLKKIQKKKKKKKKIKKEYGERGVRIQLMIFVTLCCFIFEWHYIIFIPNKGILFPY